MSDSTSTCPFCGARVSPEAAQCDLCGASLPADKEDHSSEEGAAPEAAAEASDSEQVPSSGEDETASSAPPAVYCNQCGWENPGDARFCSRCGEELQEVTDQAVPDGTRPVAADLPTSGAQEASGREAPEASEATDKRAEDGALGQQVTLVIGGALVLIIGLFFATQWSQQYDWGGSDGASGPQASQQQAGPAQGGSTVGGGSPSMPEGGGGGPAPSSGAASPTDLGALVDESAATLEGAMATQVDSLRREVENADGGARRELQAELVNLLIGAGAPGRAAAEQVEVADASGVVEDRRRAADLLYKWMRKLQGEGNRQQALEVARHVAEAYGAVADQRPEDLDARTRMGEAYLLTNSPMRGIRAINAVVEEDSTFVPARFQKGLALLQINRLDEALREFEAVKRHSAQGEPFQKQAQRAIDVIQEQRSGASGASSSQP